MQVSGFVTAGGKSSRMRQDKAWLDLNGRTMIERVIDAVRPVATTVSIIANDDRYRQLGFPVFPDTHAGLGPLEAIRTALLNSRSPTVLLAGCDIPFISTELFRYLIGARAAHQAVVPVGKDGRLQPLSALYSTDALAHVNRLIERRELKVSRLFDLVPARFVAYEEIRHLPRAELFFENINTPEEYARALKLF